MAEDLNQVSGNSLLLHPLGSLVAHWLTLVNSTGHAAKALTTTEQRWQSGDSFFAKATQNKSGNLIRDFSDILKSGMKGRIVGDQ